MNFAPTLGLTVDELGHGGGAANLELALLLMDVAATLENQNFHDLDGKNNIKRSKKYIEILNLNL